MNIAVRLTEPRPLAEASLQGPSRVSPYNPPAVAPGLVRARKGSMTQPIRIGVVGARRFARTYHIPNFVRLPDVQLVAVCNRSVQSGEQVAQQFEIPTCSTTGVSLSPLPSLTRS